MALKRWSSPNLSEYLFAAPREDRDRIRRQHETAVEHGHIVCRCGFRRGVALAFRCFYCGEWFCMACAEQHFGKTLAQWREERRVQLRQEIEAKKTVAGN